MWIARNKDGSLYAYPSQPKKNAFVFNGRYSIKLSEDEFKDVTWKNSPKEINCLPTIIDKLNYHLDTTPKDKLDKEFKELESWNHVGPTVDEYLGNINYSEVKISTSVYVMGAIISGRQELPDPETTADKAVGYADALVNRLRKR